MTIKPRNILLTTLVVAVMSIVVLTYVFNPDRLLKQASRSLDSQVNQAGNDSGLSQIINELITPTIFEETLVESSPDQEETTQQADGSEIDAMAQSTVDQAPEPEKQITIQGSENSNLATEISLDQAIKIARLEVANSTYISCEFDNDDPPVYEIVLKANERYYHVEVLAQTGLVLDVEQQDSQDLEDEESQEDSNDESDSSEDEGGVSENTENSGTGDESISTDHESDPNDSTEATQSDSPESRDDHLSTDSSED